MAGTWRNSRRASNRRCSIEPADHGNCVVQPSWLSISLTNWLILAEAASACSRWIRISDALVLLIIEEHVENAVGYERHTDDRDKERNVLCKQTSARFWDRRFAGELLLCDIAQGPLSPSQAEQARYETANGHFRDRMLDRSRCALCDMPSPHSMTSSASATNVAGTSRPSIRAVLRLMANSNFVGACAGRSPGLAPLKIRST